VLALRRVVVFRAVPLRAVLFLVVLLLSAICSPPDRLGSPPDHYLIPHSLWQSAGQRLSSAFGNSNTASTGA
jgi:hypothetical protein